jgi:signal transduction histidine kinase/ligand-binding sensor domain-containing protein
LSIYEDSAGLFWIGTNSGGLNRFDREKETFSHWINEPGNPNSLSHNDVFSIYEDRSSVLWIGTRRGLNKLVPGANEASPLIFTRWINEPGNPDSLSHNEVQVIFQDSVGILWIGTRNGLNEFVSGGGEGSPPNFKHWINEPANPGSLSHNDVRSIYEDRSGVLWIGTWDGGLNKFDREQKKFTYWKNDPLDSHSLSDNSVYSICEDRSDVLWIGTVGGLNKFDREQRKFAHLINEPGNPDSLSHNYVFSILEDRSGMIWIGTDGGGLNRFDRDNETFTYWINEPGNPNSLSHDGVYSIYEDRAGILWIGTKGGLNMFVPGASEGSPPIFKHWVNEPENLNSLSNNEILSIYEDRSGALWIGTRGGLNRLISGASEGSLPIFKHWVNEPGDPNSLSHDVIVSIYEDRAGILWIGTNGGGLNRFDRDKEKFSHWVNEPGNPESLSNNDILSIYEDQTGMLWVGTMGGGLNWFDREKGTFKRYREKDGLPNNVIYGILEDDRGSLWLSTNRGLSKFDIQAETFRNYDAHDGLQIYEFNQGAFRKNKKGEMFFGGIKGFVAFTPENIEDNPNIPPVVITSLKKFDEVLKTDIFDDEIKLSYKDKYFSFEFAALDYRNPEKNQYAYKIEGVNEEWIHSGTRRFVTYPHLGPGKYYFRVKGSNNDRVWNDVGACLKIIITPPFWGTWWFRVFVLATVLGIGVLWHKMRVMHIEAQRNRLELKVAERTREIVDKKRQLESAFQELKDTHSQLAQAEKMASLGNLAAGIAHEINNPVGAINSAANTSHRSIDKVIKALEEGKDLEEIKKDQYFKKALDVFISNNDVITMASERITGIIQSLRNFARLEEADFLDADIHEGLESTLTLLHHELKNRIEVIKEFGDIPKVYCYPNQLNQVFVNILANASHSIKDKGTIKIKTSKSDDKIVISISDDGKGIKEENLKKIFDPGFTTKGVGVGTGLGLSISYNIIKDHKGEIRVTSELGRGTEFTIILPIKQEEHST